MRPAQVAAIAAMLSKREERRKDLPTGEVGGATGSRHVNARAREARRAAKKRAKSARRRNRR